MIDDRNLVGLVNNAGIVVSGPLLYLRPSEYRRQLDVNMISPLVVIQAFASLLGTDKKRQGPTGRIVNISSSGATNDFKASADITNTKNVRRIAAVCSRFASTAFQCFLPISAFPRQ
jgi:NAD(P)-dependent dehydrogenase (short-subunit alcohol dehydrogenase family)